MPDRVGLDTSCLVALLCDWHDFHAATAAAFERLRRRRARLVIAGHALLECFAVLTRLPPPHRLPPETAQRILEENFSKSAEIPGMTPSACWSVLRETVKRGFGGGRAYDTIIALSTHQAGARLLLTWNVRDFLAVAPSGLEIREPTAVF